MSGRSLLDWKKKPSFRAIKTFKNSCFSRRFFRESCHLCRAGCLHLYANYILISEVLIGYKFANVTHSSWTISFLRNNFDRFGVIFFENAWIINYNVRICLEYLKKKLGKTFAPMKLRLSGYSCYRYIKTVWHMWNILNLDLTYDLTTKLLWSTELSHGTHIIVWKIDFHTDNLDGTAWIIHETKWGNFENTRYIQFSFKK